MFARVRELGFHTCLWLTPFVNIENVQDMAGISRGPSSNFREAADAGYLVRDSSGEVMLSDWWKGRGGLVDFTNPDAVEWWLDQLDKAREWGVKAWKCDDGEGTFVVDAVMHDGTPASEMKGRYGYLYLETMQRHIDERLGGDGVLFARPGFAGTQKFPYCWAGDNHAGWDYENGLPGVIRAGQTAALSGISLWGHDIAGYHGTQTPELFIRWTQFGCFSPLMQVHMTSNKGPWDFGPEALDIYRRYAKLHTQLFPYLHAAARESHETGMPIIRPMVLAFQRDGVARRQDFQYLFGPSILVAPIHQPVTSRSLYLPSGETWVNWWSGEVLQGGRYVEVDAPMDQIPLFVRAGALIPMLPPDVDTLVERTDEIADDVVTLDDRRLVQVWPGRDAGGTVDGITVTTAPAGRNGLRLSVSADRTLPLEVHLKYRDLKPAGRLPKGVAVRREDGATILAWESLAGPADVELTRR
jgi:alpha-D-xyloside xylohydrolase